MTQETKYVGANLPADLFDWIERCRALDRRNRSNQVIALLYEAWEARKAAGAELERTLAGGRRGGDE